MEAFGYATQKQTLDYLGIQAQEIQDFYAVGVVRSIWLLLDMKSCFFEQNKIKSCVNNVTKLTYVTDDLRVTYVIFITHGNS